MKTNLEWRGSSRGNALDACVEIAVLPQVMAVRDAEQAFAFRVVGWDAVRADLRTNEA